MPYKPDSLDDGIWGQLIEAMEKRIRSATPTHNERKPFVIAGDDWNPPEQIQGSYRLVQIREAGDSLPVFAGNGQSWNVDGIVDVTIYYDRKRMKGRNAVGGAHSAMMRDARQMREILFSRFTLTGGNVRVFNGEVTPLEDKFMRAVNISFRVQGYAESP